MPGTKRILWGTFRNLSKDFCATCLHARLKKCESNLCNRCVRKKTVNNFPWTYLRGSFRSLSKDFNGKTKWCNDIERKNPVKYVPLNIFTAEKHFVAYLTLVRRISISIHSAGMSLKSANKANCVTRRQNDAKTSVKILFSLNSFS